MITDKFGCQLNEGDWILYVPRGDKDAGSSLRHGEIREIKKAMGEMVFINIVGKDHFTTPNHCVKFSQEEVTMRKMESGIE